MKSDFYLEFEDNFRGSREQIKSVLSNYDSLIQTIFEINNDPNILDIGSGRGEWLERCSEHGFNSLGIEMNAEMVRSCRKRGLNVIEGDALSLLTKFSNNSFSIVSAFHLIEHIKFEAVNKLLEECRRILKPEGILILETPSIDSLSVATKNFHIDPTHINPINPDLLAFTLQRNGFNMVKYFFINGGPLQEADRFSLTRLLNGVAQDVSIIATKSRLTSDKIFHLNSDSFKDMNIGFTTLDAAVQFDHELRTRDNTIFLMQQKIMSIERKLSLINYFPFAFILIRLIRIARKIKNKIVIYKDKCLRRIFTLLFNLVNYFSSSSLIKYLYSKRRFFFVLRLIEPVVDKIGLVFVSDQSIKMSGRRQEDQDRVNAYRSKLLDRYKSSIRARKIHNDLKSKF